MYNQATPKAVFALSWFNNMGLGIGVSGSKVMLGFKIGRAFGVLFCAGAIYGASGLGNIAIADNNNNSLTNPLNPNLPDPLLPKIERPLSSFEEYRIEREIKRLDAAAREELAGGKEGRAFSLWYRSLRLQRNLGLLEEIIALGNIGEIAWSENRGEDLRLIVHRLNDIEEQIEITTKSPVQLFNSLGKSYRQTRYLDKAIAIYEQLLINARKNNNISRKKELLETIGKLHLDLFNYQAAEPIYQELLRSNIAERQEFYLQNLSLIYNRTKNSRKAIAVRKELLDFYQQRGQNNKLVSIYLDIAELRAQEKQIDLAESYYQLAFTSATDNQQLGIATATLNNLALLYKQNKQEELLIATYQQLITLQQETYDLYGWMQTCDRLAKIYQAQGQEEEAEFYRQQALKLANSLNYKLD